MERLTGWDVTALRFGVGALIALIFLPRVTLPPYKIILLFSMFGGVGYAVAVYVAFRMAPRAVFVFVSRIVRFLRLLFWQKPIRIYGYRYPEINY